MSSKGIKKYLSKMKEPDWFLKKDRSFKSIRVIQQYVIRHLLKSTTLYNSFFFSITGPHCSRDTLFRPCICFR